MGALEFFKKLDNPDDEFEPRIAKLGYTSIVNTIFVNLLTCFIGFIAVYSLAHDNKLIVAMLIAPLTYPLARILAYVSRRTHELVMAIAPTPSLVRPGCLWNLGILLLRIPWGILAIFSFIVFMLLGYAVDLPLRFFSEKLVAPLLLRLLKRSANIQEQERRFHFRRNALVGLALVVIGFFYQLVASVVQLIPVKPIQ